MRKAGSEMPKKRSSHSPVTWKKARNSTAKMAM